MDKRTLINAAAIICAGGMMFHSAGCLNIGSLGKWAGPLAYDAVQYVAFEFLADNDAVFDLFQDDFGTGTQYDDRFTVDATRAEPDEDTQTLVDALANR